MSVNEGISIFAAVVLVTGIFSWLSGKNTAGMFCRLAGAFTVILVLLKILNGGFADIDFDVSVRKNMLEAAENSALQEGKKITNDVVSTKISEYVQTAARNNGIEVYVKIDATNVNGTFEIIKATALYKSKEDFAKKEIVKNILKNECGIDERMQEHKYE